MSENNNHSAWFALTVKPRHEKVAAQDLRSKGLEDFLPLYHARRCWSDRVKSVELPLFPGYLFCRFESYKDRLKVLSTTSVISIISFGEELAPVEEAEIAAIQSLLRSGLPVEPWPFLRVGEPVRVESGPLTGLQGILSREKNVSRVVINVELLQRSVAVEIDRHRLSAVNSTTAHIRSSQPWATLPTASAHHLSFNDQKPHGHFPSHSG